MKTYLQRLISTAMLGLTLLSPGFPAWAGYVNLPEVIIGTDSASGSMAGARYSADNTQYIGCVFSNTNGPFVRCGATDKTGKALGCVANNVQWPVALKALTDFSFISFSVVPENAYCKYLRVDNFSIHLK